MNERDQTVGRVSHESKYEEFLGYGQLVECKHNLWCKLDYLQVPWHCRYICSGVVALETFTVILYTFFYFVFMTGVYEGVPLPWAKCSCSLTCS